MKYVCDAKEYTWFRFETEGEAELESQLMDHAVGKHFKLAYQDALKKYTPSDKLPRIEQSIGREAHIQKVMPRFLTLRDSEGTGLVTAMLPPEGADETALTPVIVGVGNSDPYRDYSEAIEALGRHVGLSLDRDLCFPYGHR